MTDAVFLSASVPDARLFPKYAETADAVAISAAVNGLLHATLGRRVLIWGGHPAITPMIWIMAESMKLEYRDWVKLYQSLHFKDRFPEDNKRFENVVYTEPKGGRDDSLYEMRERMFNENRFEAGVFIGGMKGIIEEFHQFHDLQPKAKLVPVVSTGGAVLELARFAEPDLAQDFDYVGLFHRHLGINPAERRYRTPKEQPPDVRDRLDTTRSAG